MNLHNTPIIDFVSRAAGAGRHADAAIGKAAGNEGGKEGFPAVMKKLDDDGKSDSPVSAKSEENRLATPNAKETAVAETSADGQSVELQETVRTEDGVGGSAEKPTVSAETALDQSSTESELPTDGLATTSPDSTDDTGAARHDVLAGIPAAVQHLATEPAPVTHDKTDAAFAEEQSRLLEAFRNAAELSNRMSGTDRNGQQIQSAVGSVMETPAAIIQKLQHSLSKVLGNEVSTGNPSVAKLEPAVQAAAAMVSDLQQNNPLAAAKLANIGHTTLEQNNVGHGAVAALAGVQTATTANSLVDDADLALQQITITQGFSQSGSQISFLPTANLHAITNAISSLQGRTEGLTSTSVVPGNGALASANNSSQSSHGMTIQLVPKSLGVIEIALQRTDAGVSVVIQAQTADAERLLNTDRHALQEVMRNAGIVVDEIKVATNPNLSEQFDSSRNTQQSPSGFADQAAEGGEAGNGERTGAGTGTETHDASEADPSLLGPVNDGREGLYL